MSYKFNSSTKIDLWNTYQLLNNFFWFKLFIYTYRVLKGPWTSSDFNSIGHCHSTGPHLALVLSVCDLFIHAFSSPLYGSSFFLLSAGGQVSICLERRCSSILWTWPTLIVFPLVFFILHFPVALLHKFIFVASKVFMARSFSCQTWLLYAIILFMSRGLFCLVIFFRIEWRLT